MLTTKSPTFTVDVKDAVVSFSLLCDAAPVSDSPLANLLNTFVLNCLSFSGNKNVNSLLSQKKLASFHGVVSSSQLSPPVPTST